MKNIAKKACLYDILWHIFLVDEGQSLLTWTPAGFSYDVLANGHFLPGTDRFDMARYRGKRVWKEILCITDHVCNIYFQKVHNGFCKSVTADFSNKMKDWDWILTRMFMSLFIVYRKPSTCERNQRDKGGKYHKKMTGMLSWKYFGSDSSAKTICQKQQQLPIETHEGLVDSICLWEWIAPKISSLVSVEYMAKLYEMFLLGTLGLEWIWGMGGWGGKPVTLRILAPISNRDGFLKKPIAIPRGKRQSVRLGRWLQKTKVDWLFQTLATCDGFFKKPIAIQTSRAAWECDWSNLTRSNMGKHIWQPKLWFKKTRRY